MTDHRSSAERVIPRRILLSGVWLGTVAVLAGILSYLVTTQGNPEAGAGAQDTPFAQLAREDLHAPVWSVAFSSDGTYLAATTVPGDVWLEDLATGQVLRFLQGPWLSAQSLAFAPGEHVLAVAGDQPTVRLWDVDTGGERATIEAGKTFAKLVAFSPGGALMAASAREGAGEGGVVTLWDRRTHHRLATLRGHHGAINALAFSPDGSRLASGDSQGVVRVWDTTTWRERTSLQAHEIGRIIQAVAFSPHGTSLVSAGLLDREVRFWDAATGAPRGVLPAPVTGVNALAFSPSSRGPTLAMARGDGIVSLWDVARRRELGTLRTRGATLQVVAFSPDGRRLATGGTDGALRLWDLTQVLPSDPFPGPPGAAP
jgi:WD40 repeat protein